MGSVAGDSAIADQKLIAQGAVNWVGERRNGLSRRSRPYFHGNRCRRL
jgi:hypothetical protein